jgi:hypothetical protein
MALKDLWDATRTFLLVTEELQRRRAELATQATKLQQFAERLVQLEAEFHAHQKNFAERVEIEVKRIILEEQARRLSQAQSQLPRQLKDPEESE